MKKVGIYKWARDKDNNVVITGKGTIYLQTKLRKIIGSVKPKGRKCIFEIVEIKNSLEPYLVKRKDFNFDILDSFVSYTGSGARTEYEPIYEDLLDDELLDELGFGILEYKIYYSGSNHLATEYELVKKEYLEQRKVELEEYSKKEIETANYWREKRAEKRKMEEQNLIEWE